MTKLQDPLKEALKLKKKNWNNESKEFMKKIKSLRRGLSSSKLKEPIPSQVASFISELSGSFQNLTNSALQIIEEQRNYSNKVNLSKQQGLLTKRQASSNRKFANILIGDNKFKTVLAISDKEKEIGLMYHKWPPPVMTFLYTEGEFKKFWMKNTPSPLDIVFCYNGKVVSIHKGEPFSTKMVGPNDLSDLVVELPYGTCNKFGIDVGNSVTLLKE